MTEKLKGLLGELRKGLDALYGPRLKKIILFGSQARGEADADSDVDVAVILSGRMDPCAEISRTGELVADLSLQNECVLALIFLQEERFAAGRTLLFRPLIEEGIAV